MRVEKRDSWKWTDFEVTKARIQNARDANGAKVEAAAKLLTPPRGAPIEEAFTLEFLTEPLVGIDAHTCLRFRLDFEASKHLGFSNAGSSMTQTFFLESGKGPKEAAESEETSPK